ncbi:MAG: alpha/beta fold hydrolase [Gammaproteobacteria bacterium]|nr:alpha/beta fold hydrolase [Gammaproteobacteria bacterium]
MMSAVVQRLTFALIALCAYGAVAGEPAISVSPDPRMMLEEPSIQVSGAVPGGKVIVEASLADDGQQVWTSRGVFYADSEGRVDPGTLASVDGTYTGVDAFGLFWSMLPVPASELAASRYVDPAATAWPGAPVLGRSTVVSLTARLETRADSIDTVEVSVAHRVLFAAEDVVREEVAHEQLRGVMFSSPEDGPYPPVLVVSGSGGGAPESAARAIASEGFTALAIAHFNYPDRPKELVDIPLEYFGDAIAFLKAETGHEKVGLMGASRGGEAVLLIAATYPDEVSAVVSGVPANIVNSACCSPAMTYLHAWTYQGRPLPTFGLMEGTGFEELLGVSQKYGDGLVWFQRHMLMGMLTQDDTAPYLIPVENIQSPILLISGDDDGIWPSTPAADQVVKRLRARNYAYPVEHIKVTGGGHLASSAERMFVTSLIGSALVRHPLDTSVAFRMGGTPAENFHGARKAHVRKIEFLKTGGNDQP